MQHYAQSRLARMTGYGPAALQAEIVCVLEKRAEQL